MMGIFDQQNSGHWSKKYRGTFGNQGVNEHFEIHPKIVAQVGEKNPKKTSQEGKETAVPDL